MNEVLLEAANSLKEAMDKDSRFLTLKEKEKAALSSLEVQALQKEMEECVKEYQEALSCYSKDSKEVYSSQKRLYEAKKKLDEHPLMKEYLVSFREVKNLTLEMDDILFGPFRKRVLDIKD